MTIEQIYAAISKKFPRLQTGDREPDGYSWFDGVPRRGRDSNRIVRAYTRKGQSSPELKLSITARLIRRKLVSRKPIELTTFTEPELLKLAAVELRLYRKHLVLLCQLCPLVNPPWRQAFAAFPMVQPRFLVSL